MKQLQQELGFSGRDVDGHAGPKTADAFDRKLAGIGLHVKSQGKRDHLIVRSAPPAAPRPEGDFTEAELRELSQVHPDLVSLIAPTKERCPQEFRVHDGIRTAADQNALFKRGASQRDGYNRKSEHQIQSTGYGHAVDLVPVINGQWAWDWPAIYVITEHFVDVAREKNVQIRWGGCWQHVNPLTGSPENWVQAYVKRKREQGKRAFNDGPHFELWGY